MRREEWDSGVASKLEPPPVSPVCLTQCSTQQVFTTPPAAALPSHTHTHTHQVYAVDLRHHGDSSSCPERGYHIARLAADLRDFLQAVDLADVTGLCVEGGGGRLKSGGQVSRRATTAAAIWPPEASAATGHKPVNVSA